MARKTHAKRVSITGEYNEIEYTIFADGNAVYSAGNANGDSQLRVCAEDGVGRRQMKKFCIVTAKQIAEEDGAKFSGVEYVPYPDPDSIPGAFLKTKGREVR